MEGGETQKRKARKTFLGTVINSCTSGEIERQASRHKGQGVLHSKRKSPDRRISSVAAAAEPLSTLSFGCKQ